MGEKEKILARYLDVMKVGHFIMMSDIDGNIDGSHSQINFLCVGSIFYMTETIGGNIKNSGQMSANEIKQLDLTKYHKMQYQSIYGINAYTFEKGTSNIKWSHKAAQDLVNKANTILLKH